MILECGQGAVVTGAASGIGLALARELGRRGLRLALIDIEEGALAKAVVDLRSEGIDARPIRCDVSDHRAYAAAAREAGQHLGAVDLLVNNAGVGGMLGPMWDSSPDAWTWALGVNVQGVVNGIREFLPAMIERGQGHVMNIASLAGLAAPPFLSTYAATKHAVVGLSHSLAAELKALRCGVTVSVVCPGRVVSNIMTSDRNRPAAMDVGSKAKPEFLRMLRVEMEKAMGVPMDAEDFARTVVACLPRGDFLVLTHEDSRSPIEKAVELLQHALRPFESPVVCQRARSGVSNEVAG